MTESNAPFKEQEKPEIETRRTKVMMIEAHGFMSLFTKGLEFRKRTKLIDGAPEDAQIVGITYDTRRDGVLMVIESKEYDPVPINELPPIQMIQVQTEFGGTKKKKQPRKK